MKYDDGKSYEFDGCTIVIMDHDVDDCGKQFYIEHVFDNCHVRRCWYWKNEFSVQKAVKDFREISVDNNGNRWDRSEFIKEHGSLT